MIASMFTGSDSCREALGDNGIAARQSSQNSCHYRFFLADVFLMAFCFTMFFLAVFFPAPDATLSS